MSSSKKKPKAKNKAVATTPAHGKSTKRIQAARKGTPAKSRVAAHKPRAELRVALTDKGMRETDGIVAEPVAANEVLIPVEGNGVSGVVRVVDEPAKGWTWFDFLLASLLLGAVIFFGSLAWMAWP